MVLTDVLRQQTRHIRDEISNLDKLLEQARAECTAADERVKRCSTEITGQRAVEAQSKKMLGDAAQKVAEAQRELDEIDRVKQEALEKLVRSQEDKITVERSLREAQMSTEASLDAIRKEQKTKQEAESRILRLRAERADGEGRCRQALLRGLETYLKLQCDRLLSVFQTQEQRAEVVRSFEAFKKAKHANPDISQLTEQREELKKFLSTAMVPGVKDMLQASLKRIEVQLEKLFPGALSPPPSRIDNQIDDLLFHCGADGKLIFLLPIDPSLWNTSTDAVRNAETSSVMCFIWHFLREIKLKTEDGKFDTRRGWPVFESRFDLEDVAILQSFSLKHDDSVVMQFVLSSVPADLSEALNHENENS